MLTSSYRVAEQNSDHVMVTVPASSLVSVWLVLALAAITVAAIFFSGRSIRKVYASSATAEETSRVVARNRKFITGIMGAFVVLFWAVSYTSGSIELDRVRGVAEMRSNMTIFLPTRTRTVPLSTVQEAILDEKPNARRIRLLVTRGQDLSYPIWSDRQGQDAAVEALNGFLGVMGRGEHR